MALPQDVQSTNLHDSFSHLEMFSESTIAIAPTEQPSGTSVPHTVASDSQEEVGFLTLPREIRDHIYFSLVVAADPIQYDEQFETLSHRDTFAKTSLMCMFEDASNAQIAQEARETFYEYNTFLIYTHDIPALLGAKVHTMSFEDAVDSKRTVLSTPFEAGTWVRKLAVRVGWHASGGWFPAACCLNPAHDLRTLLKWEGLRSVIIDARFGSWSYGYPQGIGWELLEEMNKKWGKGFRIYNDQTLGGDTRRYTSDRRDLSNRWLLEDQSSEEVGEVEAEGGVVGQADSVEDMVV